VPALQSQGAEFKLHSTKKTKQNKKNLNKKTSIAVQNLLVYQLLQQRL
jgi:hypothetical protein